MNNAFAILILALGIVIGFFGGQWHGAWKVQKQAVGHGHGHFIMDEDTGLKAFVWEAKP